MRAGTWRSSFSGCPLMSKLWFSRKIYVVTYSKLWIDCTLFGIILLMLMSPTTIFPSLTVVISISSLAGLINGGSLLLCVCIICTVKGYCYSFLWCKSVIIHTKHKNMSGFPPRKYYDVKNDYLLEQRITHQQRKSWVRADQCVCGYIFLVFCLSVIRRGTLEKGSSRLSSSVRPLVEPLPSEAVLDIKPEMDDDLIADEPLEISTNHSRTHGAASRHSADIYRPGQGQFTSVSSAEASSHARQQGSRTSRTSRTGSNKVLSEGLFCSVGGVLGSWI